jgi:EAL domain-containing protein (putative c-di-GMP-specific phosphodiesterase class I)
VDTLKIDRSFVRDLSDREAGAARVIQAIIDLSGKFGLRTIAEGVETENQAALLREMGVDALQGYYFSRPVTGARFANWLARSEPYLVA